MVEYAAQGRDNPLYSQTVGPVSEPKRKSAVSVKPHLQSPSLSRRSNSECLMPTTRPQEAEAGIENLEYLNYCCWHVNADLKADVTPTQSSTCRCSYEIIVGEDKGRSV